MGRLIVLIIIVIAAVWLVKRALRAAAGKNPPASPAEPQASQAEPQASQELVKCARCGVLLPRAEARMSNGVLYCSEEHSRPG